MDNTEPLGEWDETEQLRMTVRDQDEFIAQAWTIIANASEWDKPDDGTPCGNKAKEWRAAAIRWRDQYHGMLTEVRGGE